MKKFTTALIILTIIFACLALTACSGIQGTFVHEFSNGTTATFTLNDGEYSYSDLHDSIFHTGTFTVSGEAIIFNNTFGHTVEGTLIDDIITVNGRAYMLVR